MSFLFCTRSRVKQSSFERIKAQQRPGAQRWRLLTAQALPKDGYLYRWRLLEDLELNYVYPRQITSNSLDEVCWLKFDAIEGSELIRRMDFKPYATRPVEKVRY